MVTANSFGRRGNSAQALHFKFNQLDNVYNVVDRVKLCAAYALRIGLMQEDTWSALINNIIRHPSRRFI